MAKSVSQERKVTIYPDARYHKLIIASSKVEGISKSAQVGKAIRAYYDGMSEKEIEALIFKAKHF